MTTWLADDERLGIIVSPYARVARRDLRLALDLSRQLGPRDSLDSPTSVAALAELCQRFARDRVKRIGIVGGDGTIGLVLTHLAHAYGNDLLPEIVLLRGGTMNVLAKNCGLQGSPRAILARYLYTRSHGGKALRIRIVRPLLVDGRWGFVFANGAAARFLRVYYERGAGYMCAARLFAELAVSGLLAAEFFRSLLAFEHLDIGLEPCQEPAWGPRAYSMVMAASLPRLPLGLKLFHAVRGGAPAELIAISRDDRGLVYEGVRVLTGGSLTKRGIRSMPFEQASLRSALPFLYSFDGDLYEAGAGEELRIKVGPPVTIVLPA